jgi:lysophospholipase L1-like esterase
MKSVLTAVFIVMLLSWCPSNQQDVAAFEDYLSDIKMEFKKEWPANKTINLVFHGHSVPAGYFKTPVVNTMDAYPMQVLAQLKTIYPLAVINVINTSIGGENSDHGQKRFRKDVLSHHPDIVFIDYALNDRGLGLSKSKKAWSAMIRAALSKQCKVILLTPSPDQRDNILDTHTELQQHADQIIELAKEFNVGLIDSYGIFKKQVEDGLPLPSFMSQVNHPNKKGHEFIANEIMRYFN